MTKTYFKELAEYNIWANDLVHSWFDQLSDEQWQRPLVSSFKSIAETAIHTAGAEKIWLDRLNRIENPVFLISVFKGNKSELIEIWKRASKGLKNFIESFDEGELYEPMRFQRIDGKTYELEHYQVFSHALNHSTYHRGQIITLLRQVGFTGMQSLDLSTYYWVAKK